MWLKNVRYLDYNAGSGLSFYVRQKLIENFKHAEPNGFGGLFLANPSSRHSLGQTVKQQSLLAKRKVAESIHADPEQIFWTTSGTTANQEILNRASHDPDTLILIGQADHSASFDCIKRFQDRGLNARALLVLPNGQYDWSAFHQQVHHAAQQGKKNVLVSIAWANNETGVIQNLIIASQAIQSSVLPTELHLDAAQAWGKIKIDVNDLPAQYLTFTSHKVGAPAGIGFLWSLSNARFATPARKNESLSSGTENTLTLLALGWAVESMNVQEFQSRTRNLQQYLEFQLDQLGLPIHGKLTERLTNTTRFSIPTDVKGKDKTDRQIPQNHNYVDRLNFLGFAVSQGSACQSQVMQPSRVLLAMQVNSDQALNTVRVSVGPENTMQEMIDFMNALRTLLPNLNPSLVNEVTS
jgi:cysteine desulfurase